MTTVAIELNDSGLTIVREGTLLPESPGYAVLEGDQLMVGAEARGAARLKPRSVQNRFWDQLSQDPLPRPGTRAHTHADLAAAHLAHVWKALQDDCDGVIFAVPGSFSRPQLGLLLGIAQSCSMPVSGLVDAAVAAAPAGHAGTRMLHVDLHLHRAVTTHLRPGPPLSRISVETSAQIGLDSLQDHALALIAELFVRQTRFDPLHRAQSEQQLYDLVPGCLAHLRDEPRVAIQMNAGSKTHRVHLLRDEFLESMRSHYEKLTAQIDASRPPGEPLLVTLSARASAPPGLADAIRQLRGCRVIELAPGAAALGALAREEEIRSPGGSIRLVSALGDAGAPDASAPPASTPLQTHNRTPTHLLCGDVAHPLDAGPLGVGPDGKRGRLSVALASSPNAPAACSILRNGTDVVISGPPGCGARVNGRLIEGRTLLRTGDRIALAETDEELRLIAVVEERGA